MKKTSKKGFDVPLSMIFRMLFSALILTTTFFILIEKNKTLLKLALKIYKKHLKLYKENKESKIYNSD